MPYVLVVDDEPRVSASTAELLSLFELELDIFVASSFAEAAELLERPGLEALLTDHDLGSDRNGVDLLALARRLHPRANLVLMSGQSCPSLATMATKAGARTFLPKPFRPAELASALFGPHAPRVADPRHQA